MTALFGAYRTLKLQIDGYTDSTLQSLQEKLTERFGADNGCTIVQTEEFWTDVTFDQARTRLQRSFEAMARRVAEQLGAG